LEAIKNDRFFGFGTVHADMENICQEVEYITQNGLLGIKMHPDSQGFAVDDERLFPVYDMISGKIPVLFHAGDKRYDYSHPARVRRVIDMFPKLQVIAAHFGGWSMFDLAHSYLKDTDCISMNSLRLRVFLRKKQADSIKCLMKKKFLPRMLLFRVRLLLWQSLRNVPQ
jgi:predicted TIM-barrel fold metal-dependent hydrolase